MAGIIVADTIQSGGDFIRLNSASQTVATINARGVYANTGNLLIAANGTIGVASITNTAITGTMTQAQIGNGVAGTGPAFRAFLNSNQSVSTGVSVKVQLNAETFDTANCFDSTTNYRFTPNVAGYYNISIMGGGTASSSLSYNYIQIWKNGSRVAFAIYGPYATSYQYGVLTHLVYMNGTTDYIEMYSEINGSGSMSVVGDSGGTSTFMTGFLARAA